MRNTREGLGSRENTKQTEILKHTFVFNLWPIKWHLCVCSKTTIVTLSLDCNLIVLNVKQWFLQLNTTLKQVLWWCDLSQLIHSELLGMKADGNPSLNSFLFFTRSSPAVFNSCMLFSLSPSLFSLSLLPPLKSLGVLWFSKGQKRAALLSYRKAGRGTTVCYHLSLLLCQHNWCDCTHTSSSHPLSLVHCSLLLTRSTKCGCANAHTQGSAHAHIHTYRNMCTTTVGPLLSDNHFTETNQAALLLKAHPFLTLHITEDPFWSDPKPTGVVWLRERAVSCGESQLQVQGHTESGKRQPKVIQDEKLAFQMTAKDQTTLRSSRCVSVALLIQPQFPVLLAQREPSQEFPDLEGKLRWRRMIQNWTPGLSLSLTQPAPQTSVSLSSQTGR